MEFNYIADGIDAIVIDNFYTEDQLNSQNSHPPLESHDPITHALNESYRTSILAKRNLSLFLIFSHFS